ncbi:hypothetical protein AS026_15805 [Rhizobium altiplani]|uniref:Uncharacterized protein n=1 Tax=Rhizobium altiplani TaxID=1864509 RepID=A0A109JB51_9HYPH|nr:hypothetical protein [Rhizobium altiplani]KWV45669.1 hypothetical protein AS026_15805 [Rhizobium altiplani]
MAIRLITTNEEYETEYPRVRGWLIEAQLKAGKEDAERDILAGLLSGGYRLWVGDNCAAITENMEWDGRPVCVVVLAGGDLREIVSDGIPVITQAAKAQHCDGILLFGRPGWQRVLEPHGFEFSSIVMFKEF